MTESEIITFVYKIADKDLSGCVFTDVEFIGPFDGVKVKKADFEGSKGAKINEERSISLLFSNASRRFFAFLSCQPSKLTSSSNFKS